MFITDDVWGHPCSLLLTPHPPSPDLIEYWKKSLKRIQDFRKIIEGGDFYLSLISLTLYIDLVHWSCPQPSYAILPLPFILYSTLSLKPAACFSSLTTFLC